MNTPVRRCPPPGVDTQAVPPAARLVATTRPALVPQAQPVRTATMNSGPGVSVNHERVLSDVQVHAGLGFGFTLSAVKPVVQTDSPHHEIVHVVGARGVNLEYNPTKFATGKPGRFVEIQGPGVGVGHIAGSPVDVRLFGVGITGELPNPEGKTKLSYTVEVKATLKSAVQAAGLFGKRILSAVTGVVTKPGIVRSLFRGAGNVLRVVSPVVSSAFAVASIVKAVKTCRDTAASGVAKGLAVANAFFDLIFVTNPIAGVIGNIAVAGIRVARSLHAKKQAATEASA